MMTIIIIAQIKKLKKKYSFNNIAILVRAIFQTREFEERFLKIGLPYRILGGTKFYERAEIKDCVAYLRLIHQPKDDLAFGRIVNNPKRSIGESTIKLIHEFSKINSVSLEISSKKLRTIFSYSKHFKNVNLIFRRVFK